MDLHPFAQPGQRQIEHTSKKMFSRVRVKTHWMEFRFEESPIVDAKTAGLGSHYGFG